ncbi:MFS transporter [Pelagibacterium sp.]|uniref:MFS transporter n=1 Tax=Pelagibacterium sp. TaxID=1967288 RepID=UPI003BABFB8F
MFERQQHRDVLVMTLLMVTQTVGWGTGFSLLGVLAVPIGADLSISAGYVYGGVTIMFLVGAAAAPLAGQLADRYGGVKLLAPGSVGFGLALCALGWAQDIFTYYLAWAAFGMAMHFGLATSAYSAIAGFGMRRPERGIAILTLATGMSSTVFWPVSSLLVSFLDWRQVCFVYAVLVVAVGGGGHMLVAHLGRGRTRPVRPDAAHEIAPNRAGVVPAGLEGNAFWLLAVAMTLTGAVGTSMALLLIDVFGALGVDRVDAVFAASLLGLVYLASRGIDVALGGRIDPLKLALGVFVALPLSLTPLLVLSVLGVAVPVWVAIGSTILYGLPAGLLGILQPTIPLHLFGSSHYGRYLGRMARPLDLANALSPTIFAVFLPLSGAAVLAFAIALSVLALVAWLAMIRLATSAARH